MSFLTLLIAALAILALLSLLGVITQQNVDIYTQALNAAFTNSYEAIAEPPPIEAALTEVSSKGSIENYPWFFPPPLPRAWEGMRQYAGLSATNYKVPNLVYTAEFEVLNDNLNDDQIGGFKLQAAAMARGMREWKGIQVQQTLALGQTTPCFDGTNFFATSHTVGSGNNIVTGTASGSDGLTHAMACLVIANKMVKPLLWQQRDGPDFQTDMGSLPSLQARVTRWWSDLRGAAAFGFWYDAILVKFANTPTVADIQTTLGAVNKTFRGFTYPKNLPTDVNQYPHGQTKFTDKTMLIVCSTGLEHIVRQALTLSLIAQTENYFRGFADLVCSGYLDGVV